MILHNAMLDNLKQLFWAQSSLNADAKSNNSTKSTAESSNVRSNYDNLLSCSYKQPADNSLKTTNSDHDEAIIHSNNYSLTSLNFDILYQECKNNSNSDKSYKPKAEFDYSQKAKLHNSSKKNNTHDDPSTSLNDDWRTSRNAESSINSLSTSQKDELRAQSLEQYTSGDFANKNKFTNAPNNSPGRQKQIKNHDTNSAIKCGSKMPRLLNDASPKNIFIDESQEYPLAKRHKTKTQALLSEGDNHLYAPMYQAEMKLSGLGSEAIAKSEG